MSKTVFLSYARGDDESFVAHLYADLAARGFTLWWDRVSMPSRGLTFLHEIREAIDSHERFLLVLGPEATLSDYVVAEWQHAVNYGKAINPILRLGDFPLVPDELKLHHVEDFRDDTRYSFHLENLVRQLSEHAAPMGKIVGVPSLPGHLLARKDRLRSLKDALLSDLQQPVVVTGVAARVGVYGMGGIGKSVLANLLARDIEVRRAFPEGIFWVPLGTEPDLVELQRNLAHELGDNDYFDNVAQGLAKLSDLLSSRAVLLVLDDAWQRAHVEAFSALGARCRAVVTTRDAGLVTSLGGTQHHVQLFTEAESLHLLANAAEVDPSELPKEAREVVVECGYLPLAVALCAGMFKRRVPWAAILKRLKQAALESIADRNAEIFVHRNLWVAMKVSFDALAPDEQRRFIEIGVFLNNESVPEAAVCTLWSHTGQLDEFACEDLLISLSERSLIHLDVEPPRPGEAPRRRLSLHDILHDFVAGLTGDPSLGGMLSLHEEVLAAYRKQCLADWASGPNDGYFFQHLGYHLRRTGREGEWRALLMSFPWLERKTAVCKFPAVLLDLGAYAADESVGPLYRVCRRSAHVLTNDPAQLAAQLLSRLEPAPAVQPLIDDARAWRGGMWLRPVTQSLMEEPTLAVFRGREIDGHAGTPRSITLSPDDTLIASGGGSGNDLTIKIWSVVAATLLHTYNDYALALAFVSLDGRLAAADYNGVRLYTPALETDEPVARHTFEDARITRICGGGPSGVVFIGFDDGRVLAWDSRNDEIVELRGADSHEVVALACAAASPRLAIATDGVVECRDIKNGSLIGRVAHRLGGGGLQFQGPPFIITPDGSRVFFGSPLSLWSVGGEAVTLIESIGAATVVGLSQDGAVTLTAPNGKELVAIETRSGHPIGRVMNSREFSCLVLTCDGRAVATADFEHDVKLWDLTQAAVQPEQRTAVRFLAVCDDERVAITAFEAAHELWDTQTGKPVQRQKDVASNRIVRRRQPLLESRMERDLRARLEEALGVKEDDASSRSQRLGVLAFSLAAGRAVSATRILKKGPDAVEKPYRGGDDGFALEVWDLENLQKLRLLRGHMRWITCADMTADGTRALTGSSGRLLRFWDLDAGACLQVLRGHRGIVFDCAITDDARFAISGSEDMTVRLWDLKEGKLLFTFAASSAVTACDIARDGSVAMAAEISGRVHTFSVERG